VRIGALVALSVAASGGGSVAAARQDTLARLTGVVRAARDGRPLADVMISVAGALRGNDSSCCSSYIKSSGGLYTQHL